MDVPEADIIIYDWHPEGVQRVLASGSSNFIGLVDEQTVLKYPQIPSEKHPNLVGDERLCKALREEALAGLHVEEQIFTVLGRHDRIIGFKGRNKDGLLLEHMSNGSVADYLHEANPPPPLTQRLKWALQAAEALAFIHQKSVLHCDISVGNLLLDRHLNVKLADFQGRLLNSDGTVLLDGGSAEGARSSMPRLDLNHADQKTDIFALGSAIYFIMTGHPPFPELDSWRDREEIARRFEASQFPPLVGIQGGEVVRRCWAGQYESSESIVKDLETAYTLVTGKQFAS